MKGASKMTLIYFYTLEFEIFVLLQLNTDNLIS